MNSITKFQSNTEKSQQQIFFVDRENELKRMHDVLEEVKKNKKFRILFVESEQGMGKTALVDHFIGQVSQNDPSTLIGKGICWGDKNTGLVPFGELLYNLSQQGISRKYITANWFDVLLNIAPSLIGIILPNISGVAEKIVQHYRSISEAKIYKQEEVLFQYSKALEKLGEKHTIIAFIDDFQYVDDSSLSLLANLARSMKDHAILFICAYRPEIKTINQNAEKFCELYAKIMRDPQSEILLEEGIKVENYISRRFPGSDFPAEFIQQIQNKTDGNPLFIDSLFSLWQEQKVIATELSINNEPIWKLTQGVDLKSLEIPVSIGAVIDLRLRQLGKLKETLIVAAIEGDEFTAQVIARMLNLDLREVYDRLDQIGQDHSLIQEIVDAKRTGSSQIYHYRFTHRFYRDYIYSKYVTENKKRRSHKEIGEILEELYAGNLEIIAGNLAIHFQEAGMEIKAARYAILAAKNNQSRYSWAEAEQWCSFGLNQIKNISRDEEINKIEFSLNELAGIGFYKSGKFSLAGEKFLIALKLAKDTNEPIEKIVDIYVYLSDISDCQNHLDKAMEYINLAYKNLNDNKATIPFGELHLKVVWMYATIRHRKGNNHEVEEIITKILPRAESLPHTTSLDFILARTYNMLAIVMKCLCRFDDAIMYYGKAIALLDHLGETSYVAAYKINLAEVFRCLGKYDDASKLVSDAWLLAMNVGDLDTMQYAKEKKGLILLSVGRVDESLQELLESKRIADECDSKWNLPPILANTALAFIAKNQFDKAYLFATESLSLAQQNDMADSTANAYVVVGLLNMAQKKYEDAGCHFNSALKIFERTDNSFRIAKVYCHFSVLLTQQGKTEDAKVYLEKATLIFKSLNLDPDFQKTILF